MLSVSLVEAAEGVFPQCPVRICLEKDIIGTCQFMLLSFRVPDRLEDHVGVLQIIGDLPRRSKNLTETGKKRLLFFREGMRFLPEQLFHQIGVGSEIFLLHGSPESLL